MTKLGDLKGSPVLVRSPLPSRKAEVLTSPQRVTAPIPEKAATEVLRTALTEPKFAGREAKVLGKVLVEREPKLLETDAAEMHSWSASRSFSLCRVGEESLFSGLVSVFAKVKGVGDAVAMLNKQMSLCPEGLCVVFSETKGMYFMIFRPDRKQEADRIASIVANAKASREMAQPGLFKVVSTHSSVSSTTPPTVPEVTVGNGLSTKAELNPCRRSLVSEMAETKQKDEVEVPPLSPELKAIASPVLRSTVLASTASPKNSMTRLDLDSLLANEKVTEKKEKDTAETSAEKSLTTFEFSRETGQGWGLGFDTAALATRLTVAIIVEDGIIDAWNKTQGGDSDNCVVVGDQIMDVNGTVDPKEMLQEVKTTNKIIIKVRRLFQPSELNIWLDAAAEFLLNEDFDIAELLPSDPISFVTLMKTMKDESAGKTTIQALGDKILLSQLLDNLEVPQMPMLFTTRKDVKHKELKDFVNGLHINDLSGKTDAFDIVVKPTHLSNASGALILSKEKWMKGGLNADKLFAHMKQFLAEKAADSESEALKSLIPGFLVQPCYQSNIEFKMPLEMRVITLWGKARLGIWWWGRRVEGVTPAAGQKPQRTAWLVRKREVEGLDNSEESWEVLHDHGGTNKGFEKALEIFAQAMPAMAKAAESVAKAVGAPFLRSDFFAGSPKFGIRLNEVAYGSGVDCRCKMPGSTELGDDSFFIARVLQEGFKRCQRQPKEYFLQALGGEGDTYETLTVSRIDKLFGAPKRRPRLPSDCCRAFRTAALKNFDVSPVAESDCDTVTGESRRGSFAMRKISDLKASDVKASPPRRVPIREVAAHHQPALSPRSNERKVLGYRVQSPTPPTQHRVPTSPGIAMRMTSQGPYSVNTPQTTNGVSARGPPTSGCRSVASIYAGGSSTLPMGGSSTLPRGGSSNLPIGGNGMFRSFR